MQGDTIILIASIILLGTAYYLQQKIEHNNKNIVK